MKVRKGLVYTYVPKLTSTAVMMDPRCNSLFIFIYSYREAREPKMRGKSYQ